MMKKILIVAFVLCFMPILSFAETLEQKEISLTDAPQWTDFCESGYEEAVFSEKKDVFNVFTFVKAERVKKNYWATRRVDFEKYLKSCNELDNNSKLSCYENLKKSEEQKNELYKQKRKLILYENNVNMPRR